MRVLALLLILCAATAAEEPIRCKVPLSEEQLLVLLKGHVPEQRLRQSVTQCGVGFELTASVAGGLRRAGASATLVDLLRVKLAQQAETKYWASIQDHDSIGEFEEYLGLYPQGQFVAQANEAVGRLQRAAAWEAERQAAAERAGREEQERLAEAARAQREQAAREEIASREAEWHRVAAGEEAQLRAGATKVNPKDGLTYVWIPPGRFTMGCSPDDDKCDSDEKPARAVTIWIGFWIGQTLVT
jgi:hypothetical protein